MFHLDRTRPAVWAVFVLTAGLLLSACTALTPVATSDHAAHDGDDSDMAGMDHGDDGHAGMFDPDLPFDAQFIDGMVEHHVGAVDMAQEVLAQSERAELLALAEEIIAAQSDEIELMLGWRAAWFPGLPPTEGMAMDMGDMEIADDADKPFDQRFLEAMIGHHQGAIEMAVVARQSAEHEEVRALADEVIAVQQAEIAQMQAWLAEWFDVE